MASQIVGVKEVWFQTLFYSCMDVTHSIAVVGRKKVLLLQVQFHYTSLNNQFPASVLLNLKLYLHNGTVH